LKSFCQKWLKSKPESGPDCPICAEFARGEGARGRPPIKPPPDLPWALELFGTYAHFEDVNGTTTPVNFFFSVSQGRAAGFCCREFWLGFIDPFLAPRQSNFWDDPTTVTLKRWPYCSHSDVYQEWGGGTAERILHEYDSPCQLLALAFTCKS